MTTPTMPAPPAPVAAPPPAVVVAAAPPVLVRNEQSGPTTFSFDTTSKYAVVWQGKGHANGHDIQEVPAEYLNNVHFRNALKLGIFRIITEEERGNAFELQAEEWSGRLAQQKRAGEEALALTTSDRGVLIKHCPAPDCGAEVRITPTELREKPPLCPEHRSLAPQFIAEEGERTYGGIAERIWTRPTMQFLHRGNH